MTTGPEALRKGNIVKRTLPYFAALPALLALTGSALATRMATAQEASAPEATAPEAAAAEKSESEEMGRRPAGRVITIDEAVALAKKNNPEFVLSETALARADANVDRAWAALKPTLNGNLTYTYNSIAATLDTGGQARALLPLYDAVLRVPGSDPNGDLAAAREQLNQAANAPPVEVQGQNSWRGGITLAMPLLNGAAIPALAATKATAAAQAAARALREASLEFDVRRTYYLAAGLRELIGVSRTGVEQSQDALELTKARYEVGLVAKLALVQAETDLELARQDLIQREISYDQAKEGLAALMFVTEAFEVEAPKAAMGEVEAQSNEAIYKKALDTRLDLKATQLQLKVAEDTELARWLQFAPSLSFAANLNFIDPRGFQPDNWFWSIALTLSVPLYDGGLRYADLKTAKADQREAEAQLEQTRRGIKQQIATTRLDIASSRAAVLSARKLAALRSEQRQIVLERFNVGLATGYDVSEANRLLRNAEVDIVRAELNHQFNLIALEAVTTIPVASSGASTSTSSGGAAPAQAGAGSASASGGAAGGAAGGAQMQ